MSATTRPPQEVERKGARSRHARSRLCFRSLAKAVLTASLFLLTSTIAWSQENGSAIDPASPIPRPRLGRQLRDFRQFGQLRAAERIAQRSVEAETPNDDADNTEKPVPIPLVDPAAPAAVVPTTPTDSLDASAAAITLASIEQREKELADKNDLTDEERQRIADLYTTAKASLERANFLEARLIEFGGSIESVKQRNDLVLTAIEQAKIAEPTPPDSTDVAELEALLAEQEDQLKKLKEQQLSFDEQTASRSARRNEIRQRIPNIDPEIADVRKQAAAAAVTGDSPLLSQAKRVELLTHLRVATREKPTLEEELRLYDAEAASNLLQSQRSLNAVQLDTHTEQVRLTTNALQRAREQVAGTTVANAAEAAKGIPKALLPIAEESRLLAEANQQITRNIQTAEIDRQRIQTRLDELKQRFTTTQAKVETVGLPASVGAMLRNQRAGLPEVGSLRVSARTRSQQINKIQLEIFDLNEESKRLVNIEDEARRAIGNLSNNDPTINNPENIAVAEGLLRSRSDIIDSLHRSKSTYFETLTNTSIAEQQLIRESADFREYIDERVLWIRSHPNMLSWLSKEEWNSEKLAIGSWRGLPRLAPAIVADAKNEPFNYFIFALFTGVLVLGRPVFHSRLRRIAEMVRSSAYSHFFPSLAALTINALSCLLLPAILGFLGWRLSKMNGVTPLAGVLGKGLILGAVVTLPLAFFSRVFSSNGLADAHFDWSKHTSQLMRANIRWVRIFFVPLVIVGATMFNLQATTSPGLIHRVLFVIACLAVAFLGWRVLHPQRGLPKDFLERHAGGWLERLKAIWFWGLLAIPVSLAVLAISGYSYTAHELAWRGFVSLAIAGVLWILHGLSMRLLLVHRRRLAVERARARYAEYQRQQESARRADGADGSRVERRAEKIATEKEERIIASLPGVNVTSSGLVMGEDPLADLRANTEQSRRFVTTLLIGAAILMLWMTWHNVLPALGFLEQWPLWNSSREIAETITNEAGLKESRTREVVDPVTIADAFLAIFVTIVGFIGARDLPGLLELAVLQRLPLEKSVRYAITTISSYVAVAIGLFVAFRLVGLRWQQIQWMATALTFGLAFGLQEMFANFVAGIILLFERPIRVGDIVTIDEITGVVSRVRMRATTVTNFDRKDYIVPNKDFITGRMLNWTLSDHVNRISIEVGVAYGTDTELVKTTLMRIASDHKLVENEPPPMATFEKFQSSSLCVVLRCFISMANMPMRLEVVDELHTSIDAAFKAANIEIAFPQQDLNIRSVPADLKSA